MIIFIIAFTLGVSYVTFKEPVPVSKTSQQIREQGTVERLK